MDCFYAAIEMRDNPQLRNRPLAVGGISERRSVLCTCNYIAREFGVRSAMPTVKAYQLCPDLIIVPPDISKYKKVSAVIQEIFSNHTDIVEPLSLDEAYLDVTNNQECFGSATWLAQKIRQEIFADTGLTVSAGIAPNKFLAKIASDWRKPNGQFTIAPQDVDNFIKDVSVKHLWGVGRVTLKKLETLGIYSCADVQRKDKFFLAQHFGSFGQKLYELARGIDEREVSPSRERKSVSVEHTYNQDIFSLTHCFDQLPTLVDELVTRKKNKYQTRIKSLFVKIKFNDFTQTTAECASDQIVFDIYKSLMQQAFMRQTKPVRLLGVGIRLREKEERQMQLGLDLETAYRELSKDKERENEANDWVEGVIVNSHLISDRTSHD